jgi:hypothetical protein
MLAMAHWHLEQLEVDNTPGKSLASTQLSCTDFFFDLKCIYLASQIATLISGKLGHQASPGFNRLQRQAQQG